MSAKLEFEVFTIFPGAISAFVEAGLMGKAIARELVAVHSTDLREFTDDRHRSVDDAPFGGGAGMVMKPGPVVAALEAVEAERGPMYRILLTPSAPRFDQRAAEALVRRDRIALLCGRYEGIDDRVREHYVDACFSIGDFVLNGGEVAAAVIIEAVARLREGVLGNPDSIAHESFADIEQAPASGDEAPASGDEAPASGDETPASGDETPASGDNTSTRGDETPASGDEWRPGQVLEHPHYTRPATFRGHAVPELLLGGDHRAVEAWRRRSACLRTWALRPELRPNFSLAPAHPIVLASSAARLDPAGARELAALAEAHGVEAVVVGPGPKPAEISKLRDLKQLQRDLRKRAGRDPWLLGVGRAAQDQPVLAPRLILDVLAYERQAGPAPLILWVGGCDDPALAKRPPLAWMALSRSSDPASDISFALRLALAPSLIDISQPQAAPEGAVSLARAALSAMRQGGLLRSRSSEQHQETSP